MKLFLLTMARKSELQDATWDVIKAEVEDKRVRLDELSKVRLVDYR